MKILKSNNKISKFSQFSDFLIDLSGLFASILIPILILTISISVILRYFFSIGFTWIQDLYIWIHASIILLGISYTFKFDEHVRIDLFYRNTLEKKKLLINLFGNLLFTLPFSYILTIKSYPYFYRSFVQNESSKEAGGLPGIYFLKFLIFIMGILLSLQTLNLIFKAIKKWK